MALDQYVSFSWSNACLTVFCRLSDRNEIGLASFFTQKIVFILHVAILHLFSTFSSQRSTDRTSQDQQTKHDSTSSNGVMSEITEVLAGRTAQAHVHPQPSNQMSSREMGSGKSKLFPFSDAFNSRRRHITSGRQRLGQVDESPESLVGEVSNGNPQEGTTLCCIHVSSLSLWQRTPLGKSQ